MKNIMLGLLIGFSLCANALAASSAEQVMLYSYHNHPPFVTAKGQGLTYDLADKLNVLAAGKYQFQVKIVPRGRLNLLLKDWISGKCPTTDCSQQWLVPWVNPKWGFIRGESDNYLWHSLFTDSNVIVSNTDTAFTYEEPASLKGLVLAGMRGHRYVGIDELVASGDITRIDGNRERDNLLKVLHKRVTATLLPNSTMQYLLSNDPSIKQQASQFKISATKHQLYQRFIMLPGNREDLLTLLKSADISQLISGVE